MPLSVKHVTPPPLCHYVASRTGSEVSSPLGRAQRLRVGCRGAGLATQRRRPDALPLTLARCPSRCRGSARKLPRLCSVMIMNKAGSLLFTKDFAKIPTLPANERIMLASTFHG